MQPTCADQDRKYSEARATPHMMHGLVRSENPVPIPGRGSIEEAEPTPAARCARHLDLASGGAAKAGAASRARRCRARADCFNLVDAVIIKRSLAIS